MSSTTVNTFELLRSNFGTYTVDVEHVSQCLIGAERDVQNLEAEIHRLNAAIIVLQNKQELLHSRIEQCRSLLAPIRRIPPELLARIFSFACSKSEATDKLDCPAVRLSQVCKGWRELTHTTPSLWSSLSIDLITHDRWDVRLIAMADHHLELSRNSPLDVTLKLRYNCDVSLYLFKALSAHSSRLHSLCLYLDDPELLEDPYLLSCRNNLPLLRHLNMRVICSTFSQKSVDVFKSAPLLEDFTICWHMFNEHDRQAPPISLPWSQLTRLKFRWLLTNAALENLSLAAQARHVTFERCRNDDFRDSSDDYPDVVHLHDNLRSLSIIIDIDDPELSVFFNFLTLPSLIHLTIAGSYDETTDPPSSENFSFTSEQEAIMSFMSRSQCHLTSLSLENLPIQDMEVIAFLQNTPTLTELALYEQEYENTTDAPFFTPHLFDSLSVKYRAPSSTLLPRLKELDLQYHACSFPTTAFLPMIHSRWIPDVATATEMGVDCLAAVTLRPFMDEKDEDLGPDLQSLGDLSVAGLRVLVLAQFLD
ncbi:hypothetical protein D9758_012738 [Tetrapyrgos nigripes]|uniref:F-box domain-containing protein n=1 Tax=Tetrapyrgos nigripes TaxID=182062 RepID=A0A8H5CWR5_9AGAR|nr:hypothetical protein D9758_012738 [Tetrapyrgos nigripes]